MRHNQNRRSRGRSRKGPNPLTRSYESNGPDVKVRGTAAHVAEKYMTLARDAVASGDSVAAENYFQHAEHYNRIVQAAQAQFQQQQPQQFRDNSDEGYDDDRQMNGRGRYDYNGGDGRGDDGDDGYDGDDDRGQQRAQRQDEQGDRDQGRDRDQGNRDQGRQRGQRGRQDARREGRERYEEGPRSESQEAADPAFESQPDVANDDAPVAEVAAEEKPAPRRRRRSPKPEINAEGGPEAEDKTKDGAAALAAFPE